jgi:hypothetical protein
MGKKNWKTRLKAKNLEELRGLKARIPMLQVLEFQSYHLRLIGTRAVDFWPSTGRAWIVDDYDTPSAVMTAAQVVALAFNLPEPLAPMPPGCRCITLSAKGETHGAQ